MDPFKPTNQKSQKITKNPIEQIKDIGSDIGRSATNDLVVGVARDVVDQVFGTAKSQSSFIETSKPSGEINKSAEQAIRTDERRRIELFRKQAETAVFSSRDIEVAREIQTIQFEIKRIIATSKDIEMTIKTATIAPIPEKPGEYHLTFFQFVLRIIKDARLKVEESKNWLNLFISKKKQKNYWAMFKKHGTQFGLSNERSTATQTG